MIRRPYFLSENLLFPKKMMKFRIESAFLDRIITTKDTNMKAKRLFTFLIASITLFVAASCNHKEEMEPTYDPGAVVFNVSSQAISDHGIDVVVRHNGKERDGWNGFLTEDLTSPIEDLILAQAVPVSKKDFHFGTSQTIRLTNLDQPLLDKVDQGELGFTPAVELSYLKPQEQEWVHTALEATQQTPSLSQAQRIKQESKEGTLTEESVHRIISEEKKPLYNSVTLSHDTLKKYFPRSYTAKQMEKIIIKLLDNWLKHRQQTQER